MKCSRDRNFAIFGNHKARLSELCLVDLICNMREREREREKRERKIKDDNEALFQNQWINVYVFCFTSQKVAG